MSEPGFNGTWRLGLRNSHFGFIIESGLDAGRCIFAVLPRNSGWFIPEQHPRMPHQLYQRHASELLERHPDMRELAIIDLDSGTWISCYLRDGETSAIHG